MGDVSEPLPECPNGLPERQYSIADEDELFVIDSVDQDESSSSSADVSIPKTYTYDELVNLCGRIGLSSEMIDGVLVQLLTQHFSAPEHYLYSGLDSVRWSTNSKTRTLNIYSLTSWQGPESIDSPAIVYSNLGQRPKRIAIGDQFYHNDDRPDTEGFARQYHGAHRLMCIGHTDGQAELLATELSEWLTMFSPWLTRNLPFLDFQVAQREPPKIYSELGDKVGVALAISYSYIWAWEMVPVGPPLKAVTLNV